MDHSATPKQKPGYHMEEIEGELLLYHLNETRIMYCNQTAALIWRLSDGRSTVGEMISLLSGAYPNAAGTMTRDVELALGRFLAAGAIEMA
ncbi:MAG TPA: PqqD family protein [Anaerolineae bacterium]|jgi:hypothetical protein|nr:PqqD family protein [Anaerolineae bacterium]